jgi:hypothetical protein
MAGVMTYGFWKVGKGIREQKSVSPASPFISANTFTFYVSRATILDWGKRYLGIADG